MAATPEQLEAAALNAERLKNDPVFQSAVLDARKLAVDALVALAEADATYLTENRRLRAEIAAIDGLSTVLANAILRKPRGQTPVA